VSAPGPRRRLAGALLGPLVFAALLFLDLGLDPAPHRLAAIGALVVLLWITEALPVPVSALLGSVLCILLGVAPARTVLAPYADPVIFLFLGAFVLGEALTATGLDERFARGVVAAPALSATPARLVVTVGLVTAALSMWMSNTAAAAIMTPLALSVARGRAGGAPRGGARTVVLVVAYAASLGGIATPVGTPPNLIAIGLLERQTGTHIGFLPWMRMGLPLAILLTGAMLAVAALALRARRFDVAPPAGPARRTPLTGAERATLAVFGCMVAAWLLPSLIATVAAGPFAKLLTERLPESVVALGGAVALFALPARIRPWAPVLEWQRISRIDWGTILLFGGGLSLGGLVVETGLGARLGDALLTATGVTSLPGLVALSAGCAVVLTEFMSNTAATNAVAPVVYSMAVELGVDPAWPVVAVALGASMAFALPVSTPPNAIAYATGEVTVPQMALRGIALDVAAFAAIVGWLGFVAT
jgi:sodium-dependent dicarboxylate transporter 2/3/5